MKKLLLLLAIGVLNLTSCTDSTENISTYEKTKVINKDTRINKDEIKETDI